MIFGGSAIIASAEIMKFSGHWFFTTFFTPIVWTGYIILVDGINYLWHRRSLIIGDTRNFLWMLPISVGLWYLFEFYNLFIENWRYVGLPENRMVRYFGYFWSFATIWPGIFETYILLTGIKLFDRIRCKSFVPSPRTIWIMIFIGTALELIPLLFPNRYWAPAIWTGFVLMLDPINYRLGLSSILRQLRSGTLGGILRLFATGLVCGFLWEFWNFWAGGKWVYSIPYLGNVKIFEMPIIGFLGFIPFAVEVFVMYVFVGWVFKKILDVSFIHFEL